MRTRGFVVVTVALVMAAWSAEQAGAQEEQQRGLLRVLWGQPALRQAFDSVADLGEAIPAVGEELARHRQAMLTILAAHLSLANQIDAGLRELREMGAEETELVETAKTLAPQASELAAKRAAELATHYANLAKILNPEDEAKRKEVVAQLAEGLIKRMATQRGGREQFPFGRFGGMIRRPGGFGPGGEGAGDRRRRRPGGRDAEARDDEGRQPGGRDRGRDEF